MRVFELESILLLPRPLDPVFAFFADPANLERITPPWLRFEIATPLPIEMRVGTRIDYRLRVRGIPMRWQSEITVWEPPDVFVDVQRSGPYRLWEHTHRFESIEGATRVFDHVRYAVPGGWLINRLFVAPDLKKIFDYRHQELRSLFA